MNMTVKKVLMSNPSKIALGALGTTVKTYINIKRELDHPEKRLQKQKSSKIKQVALSDEEKAQIQQLMIQLMQNRYRRCRNK